MTDVICPVGTGTFNLMLRKFLLSGVNLPPRYCMLIVDFIQCPFTPDARNIRQDVHFTFHERLWFQFQGQNRHLKAYEEGYWKDS